MRLPEEMHPLVKRAAGEAMRGFSPQFLARLRADLIACTGESLRDAARELIFLGVVLEECGELEASAMLFALVESAAVIAALDGANASRVARENDAAARGAERFARFAGGSAAISAGGKVSGMKLEALGPRRFAGLRLR